MKLRSVELVNIRRFAGQRATLDAIGDGIAVLSEPNEFGKSTFLDAIQALFFAPHRQNSDFTRSLRPHSGGAPEAAVEIELPDGRFRLHKRWLSRPTARITDPAGRMIAQDDEAEAWIDRLLGAGLAGPSGLLWVRQGTTMLDPEGTGPRERAERERGQAVRRDLLSSVAGEIEAMTGGRRMDVLRDRVEAELARLATATLKPKATGDWSRAVDEAAALARAEAELAPRAKALSAHLVRRAEVQRALARLSDPGVQAEHRDRLASAQAAFEAARAHADRVRQAEAADRLADLTEQAARQDAERLETLAHTAGRAEQAARDAAAAAAAARERADRLAEHDRAATEAEETADRAAASLRARLSDAQRAQLAQAARGQAEELGRRLDRAQALATRVAEDRARRMALAVSPRTLATAEAAQAEVLRLTALAGAQAVTVQARPSQGSQATMGGVPLGDAPLPVTEPVVIDLPGFGALRVDPGPDRTDATAAARKAAGDALARALAACGAGTLPEARDRLSEAAEIDRQVAQNEARLAEVAPAGLEALRLAAARARSEAAEPAEPAEDPAALEAPLAVAEAAAVEARAKARADHALAVEAAKDAASAAGEHLSRQRAAQEARVAAGGGSGLDTRMAAASAGLPALAVARAQARKVLDDLRATAPDLATAEAALARARTAAEAAQAEDRRLREELAGLNAAIGALADEGIEERLADITGQRAAAEARAARYEAEVRALVRLRSALEEARTRARDTYLAPVLAELQPLISILHPDAALHIDDQTLLPAVLTRAGQAEALDILSGGTREQIAILTRLAFARLFARTGRPVPVILDDALVHSDDDRIEAMFTALHRVARDQQVLVFTCRQRAFAALGGERLRVRVEPA
ncbi:MAG TPA: ATP-binding protein [Paracoccaceae bacterium]|mgnify:FL=1|nr:ATP-binding protein [Paracoccaceae bacterium]